MEQRSATVALPRRPAEIPRVYDWFGAMRETRPVVLDETYGMPMWLVFGYDDVATVLTDHARFSSQRAMFGEALDGYGVAHDIKVYPGARHSFFNDRGRAHDPDAAADSWQRTLSFFEQHLA
jgi:dienelactone hydrolase